MPVLAIENLSVNIGDEKIIHDIAWQVEAGETLGIVGESGSGKSMSLLAIAGLLPRGATRRGSIRLKGVEISEADESAMCKIRGAEVGVIFQEPMTALNPVHTIGRQVAEAARTHWGLSRGEAETLSIKTLTRVGLPPEKITLNRYPHQLSGGQRQRVAIAMAIILKPKVILADEPTTALDVTTQAEVLKLLARLAKEDNCALVLVTHDLPLISQYADQVVIMKAGEVVETCQGKFKGRVGADSLTHPYSKALFQAAFYTAPAQDIPGKKTVLDVRNLTCAYRRHDRLFGPPSIFRAVKGINLKISAGETLALVGESGCGKSTLSKAIMGLLPISSGEVFLGTTPFVGGGARPKSKDMVQMRRRLQMVFQDPYGSFNPRQRIDRIITEPFYLLNEKLSSVEAAKRVDELLDAVGLRSADAKKYPHEFSGGQRQRIAIARAMATSPEIILLDEAVSALDVTVRAQILDLLTDLRERMQLAYLFISHDLSVVRGFAHRVLVMREGEIIEEGETEKIFTSPAHPYTAELLAATPEMAFHLLQETS